MTPGVPLKAPTADIAMGLLLGPEWGRVAAPSALRSNVHADGRGKAFS